MSSGRTPGFERNTAVGPPGAAWISAKTTREMSSRSGTDVASRRMLLHRPLVHVPEGAGVGRIALEPLERRRYRVELGDVVERDLDGEIGDPMLRLAQQTHPLREIDRAIGGVDEFRQRLVVHEIDVSACRRRSIAGEEQCELWILRHLEPVQDSVVDA